MSSTSLKHHFEVLKASASTSRALSRERQEKPAASRSTSRGSQKPATSFASRLENKENSRPRALIQTKSQSRS